MNSMKSKLLSLQIVLMVSLFSVMACSSSDSSEMSEMITLENDLSDKVSQSSVSEFGDKVFTRIWSDPPTLDPHLTGDTTSSAIVVDNATAPEPSKLKVGTYLRMLKPTHSKLEKMLSFMMVKRLQLMILNGHLTEPWPPILHLLLQRHI